MDSLDGPVDAIREVGAVGVAVAAALAALALLLRSRPGGFRKPVPLAGLALTGAILVAVRMVDLREAAGDEELLGVSVAAAGALVAVLIRLPWWARPMLVLPGAVLTIDAMNLADRPAVVGPTVVAGAVLAALTGESDRIHGASAAGPPLLAVSIFGMYTTIPETGQILPALVVAVPIALLGGPVRLARLGSPGAAAVVVLLAAMVAEGGQTRPSSILGGLACLGVLALEPVVRAAATAAASPGAAPPAEVPPDDWRSPYLLRLTAIHVVVVVIAARVAGLREDLTSAAVIVAVTGALAAAALFAMVREMVPERGRQ
jgi:hypothetical protein